MNKCLGGSGIVFLVVACGQSGGQGSDHQSDTPSSTQQATSGVAPSTNVTSASGVDSRPSDSTSSGEPSSAGTATSSAALTTQSPDVSSSAAESISSTSDDSRSSASGIDTTSEHNSTETGSSVDSMNDSDEPGVTPEQLNGYAEGLDGFYLHDECTSSDPNSDVCAHLRVHEETIPFGGDETSTYEVKLRIRGLFEPTNINGGTTPYAEHPYFKVGGTVTATDYSQWQLRVTAPEAVYYLNHYPATGHTIYKQDFEASIRVQGGASVVVRVEDANDRQIDNGYVGLPDRRQVLEGVTDEVVNGQVLRLDVLEVTELD